MSPEIPPSGPRAGLHTTVRRFLEAVLHYDILSLAAGLAFYLLFSLFPLVLVFLTLLAFLPIPNLDKTLLDMLARVAPPELTALLRTQVIDVVTQQRSGLLSLGFVLALWSASGAARSAVASLNRGYEVQEHRPRWKLRLQAIVLTVALSALVVGSLALIAFGPSLGEHVASLVGLGSVFATIWNAARWPVALAAVSLGAAILYYFGPDIDHKFRWITPGSVFATGLWVAVSFGLGFYARRLSDFNETYGTLGAAMFLLFWLYLSAFCFLAGGVLNAVIAREGSRGATQGERGRPATAPEAETRDGQERGREPPEAEGP